MLRPGRHQLRRPDMLTPHGRGRGGSLEVPRRPLVWQRSLEALMPSNWQPGGHLGQQPPAQRQLCCSRAKRTMAEKTGPAVSAEQKNAKHAQQQEADWLPGGAGDAQAMASAAEPAHAKARRQDAGWRPGGVCDARAMRRFQAHANVTNDIFHVAAQAVAGTLLRARRLLDSGSVCGRLAAHCSDVLS